MDVSSCRWIAAMVCCLAVAAAFDAEAAPRAHCPKPISFGLYEHGVMYDAATGRGLDKDFADLLAARTGCRFDFVLRSRARIWHDLEAGTLMMTGSAIGTQARREFAWFANHLASKNYVLVREGLAVNSAQAFEKDASLRWGAVRGYQHGQSMDRFLARLRLEQRVAEVPDVLSAYRDFLRGRTDAMFIQSMQASKYIKDMPPQQTIRLVDWFPEDKPVHAGLALSKKHFSEADARYWRKVIAELLADGSLRKLYGAYMPADQVELTLNFKQE